MTLLEMLPEACYHGEPHVAVLQDAVEKQVRRVQAARDDLKSQARPSTAASWGMSHYERAWGLPVDESKPLDQRLAAWRARRRGVGAITAAVIKSIAQSFYDGEIQVAEHKREFWFEVVFKSRIGIPPGLEELKAIIENVKPAHMEAVYTVLWNTHESLSGFTHQQLSKYTHEQLRTSRVV